MKEQDCLRRFIFEEIGIRGEWVRLHDSWEDTKKNQQLDSVVQEVLGQALAAVVLLSVTIKYEGSMVLQVQGNGALKAVVAHSTHDRKIRGLARSDAKVAKGNFTELMGEGRLVITVEPKVGEPYQGIVPLLGNNLADVITHYFLQSEQLETRVWLFANESFAAGLFLQELPGQENDPEDWERICTLANTLTEEEILALDSEELLYRLFNEEKVRLFAAEAIEFECSCSRRKIESTLITLGRKELESILRESKIIDVGCEFCGSQYSFDKIDVENLLSGQAMNNSSETRH